LGVALFSISTATAGEIGFIEDFALARDREEALKKLIPGTEDYYYFNGLHYLNTDQFDKIEPLAKIWHERFGQTARLTEIQTRYAILICNSNPAKSLAYLRDRLGLQFNHQKVVASGSPNLPTALDQRLIARSTLLSNSLQRWTNLDNFEDSALDWLAAERLDWQRRRNLLQRLQRPDIANLSRLVVDDLLSEHAQEFGSWGVHRQMTLSQLNDLLKLKPDVLNQTGFVQTYITKLHPGDDADWRRDPVQLRAYLDRLLAFSRQLAPVHNALKAHVLFHRLVLDRSQGTFDRAIFDEYIKLPRQQPYMSKAMLESEAARRYGADLNADFTGVTLLPVVGNDEPMVRSYLKRFFVNMQSASEFEPLINDIYLRHLFAETKIELGQGDSETWASALPPELFKQLKERIDIDFAFTNKTSFLADEPVTLDLFVKNVPTLLVKVFEVNTTNFYRTQKREVDTDINLDGLVANSEQNYSYKEPPLRRMPRKFEFPQLNKPGVYVIDFIGGGKSSRALVRKGRLRPLVSASTAGHRIHIVDDADQAVKDASIWLGGQEYKPDANGMILVPFSTSPGRHPIVISRGDFSCLDFLQHNAEAYHLAAGIHVDRESLITQRIAPILIRPGLYLNGLPVSVKLLEEVRLRVTAVDQDGIATSTEVPNFKLFEDRESTYEVRVPPRLVALQVALLAKVKSLSENRDVDLSTSQQFTLNGITKTEKIEDLHLAKFGNEFMVEVLGRTGEIEPDRPVQISIKHRDFREQVAVTLKTDVQGRVHLGPLADITFVTATGPEGTAHTWNLPTDRHTYRQVIHAKAGETISFPYVGTATAPSHEDFALFEMRGSTVQADRFEALAVKNGSLELRDLPAGDYDLWLKQTGERMRIRVVDGPTKNGYVLGKIRHMQLPALKPVHISGIETTADEVIIRLRDSSSFARVHVFATRYEPAYSAFSDISRIRDAELGGVFPAHAEAAYLTGRNIGDEYRYVLDRRMQRKYPGNLLQRPELLLNPWVVRSTDTGEQMAQGGEDFGRKGDPPPAKSIPTPETMIREGGGVAASEAGAFTDLDFLADSSAVLVNLIPDKDGVVKLNRKDLGPHAMIHVVAVDPVSTTYRSVTLPEQKASFVDLRLRNGLDPKSHFTQQKQIGVLEAGKPFVLADAAGARFEVYDSLPKVYALYATLSKDPKLAEFAFILTWPKLKPEEKRAMYSKFACHELNFFLLKKDPDFFHNVIRPYLGNKKDKTFLDHWLLGEDLLEFLQPWQYGRLNAVERVLLAQRLAGEPAKTSRHEQDLLRLLPPNMDRFLVLFDTAVKGSALSGKDTIVAQLDRLKKDVSFQMAIPPMGGDPKPAAADAAGMPMSPAPPGADAKSPRAGLAAGGARKKEVMARDGQGDGKDKATDAEKLEDNLLPNLGLNKNGESRWFDDDRKSGKLPPQLYRKVDVTKEWAENNYYNLPISQQIAALVPASDFWLDYSRHSGKGPFLSENLADASKNFTEMMFALSVLDLPFEAGKQEVKFDGGKMIFTPGNASIAFHEEVKPAADAAGKVQILVSQNFYRFGDRFREENGERFDKFISQEFVQQTVYGAHIVVTNPTSTRQKLSVLIQVPVGAIPVGNGQPTKTVMLDLESYRTQTIDYLFYFPRPGKFEHFPVHVAKAEALVASAQPFVFNVVEKPSKLDTESWDYISQNGSSDQVLAYLDRENVFALDLSKIAFRMRDKTFFATALEMLRNRHAYEGTLWSYGIFNNDVQAAREFLTHMDAIVNECGGPIQSPILLVDPVARHQYEHLEYKPLVNARAHSLGQRRQIVNDKFLQQYERFLKGLSYRKQLTDDDRLAEVYYLLLQDRVEQATTAFEQVHVDKIATRMQYDYCAAYLDLFNDEPQRAKAIAAKYANYPVDRWRNTFAAMLGQLNEIENKAPAAIADKDERDQRQNQLAQTEPGVEFTIDSKNINLTWQNVDACKVNYYLMDVELLFSRNPFVQQSGGQFSSIKPNLTQDVKLPKDQKKLEMHLPEALLKRNVLVEISAGGKTRSEPYYANAMEVKLSENYGQLRVTDSASGKALSKVYVKTYARLADGTVKFYKDGYTDLRGRFDYASVSTPEKSPITRFSILVLSDEHGALIREANPPQQ
jgi:hypothetical protein